MPEGDSSGPTKTTIVTISSGNSYFLPASINERRIDLLVDTGSAFSILRKDTWDRLFPKGKDLTPSSRNFVGVDGNRLNVQGSCQVPIVIRGKTFAIEVYVIDDITAEAILGLNFLEKNNACIDTAAGRLTIPGAEVVAELKKERGASLPHEYPAIQQIDLCAQNTLTVPRWSEVEIETSPAQELPEGTWLVESQTKSKHPLLLARSLIHSASACPVRIMNLSQEDVVVYGGSKVAVASPIGESNIYSENQANIRAVSESLTQDNREALQEVVEQAQDLTETEKDQLFKLLHSYSNIFAQHTADFGRTGKIKHRIDTGDSPPIRQPFRRTPPNRREDMTRLLGEMSNKSVIQPSTSPWASPVVLVRKKDGSHRFCIDYRKVNAVTRKDAYPLPRIDDTLDTLSGSQWFSTLDLISGYWQVEVDPQDKPKTAFATPDGLFEFNVMPFGLCNAPATFQRLMNMVLAGLQWTNCLVYLDDVIVMGRTFEEHLHNLATVFDRLQEANLKLKPQKCAFAKKQVTFLGHIVSPRGIATDPEKTAKVANWPEPQSPKEVQQFLGLASYYRRFIKDFASIAKPLHRLTEKASTFRWTQECTHAFEELRKRLVSSPVLAFPDYRKPFILDTDASDLGIGAVLSQVQEDGQERVVAYASRVLSKPERRYCVTRKELLAVVAFVQHFRSYLLGSRFTLRTDHGSLTWLWNFKEPQGQLARWLEKLQEFDFTILHRPGKRHGNADALSRLPCQQCGRDQHQDTIEPTEDPTHLCTVSMMGQDDISLRDAQLSDPDVGPILTGMECGQKPTNLTGQSPHFRRLLQLWDQLVVNNSLLWRNYQPQENSQTHLQLIVPKCLRDNILEDIHGGTMGAHLGEEKTLMKLKERYYWPGHHTDTCTFCKTCSKCAARKSASPRRRGQLHPVTTGYPMQLVAVDILGPLPESRQGNVYLLVVADYFTRWMEAYPIPNQEAATVAKVLTNEYFLRFSPPEQLHSDQGRQFEAEVLEEICKLLGIRKTRTTAYHPQSDGLVERFNRTLLSMLSTMVGKHHDLWEEHVRSVCMAYNTSIQSTTGYSPFYLMFGRQARLPIDLMYGAHISAPTDVNQYAQDVKKSLQEAYNNVRRNFQLKQSRQKEFYDQRIHGKPFDKDTLVWLHSTVIPRGCSRKFHHPWTGPYRVIKRISDVTYRIQSVGGRRKRLVVHFDRLKPCDPNTRFDHHGHTPSGQEDNNPPRSPPVADPPVTFGRELQLLDHSTSDSPDQVRRYPERRRQHPDRYGVSIGH